MKFAFCKWKFGRDVLLEEYLEDENSPYIWWNGLYWGFFMLSWHTKTHRKPCKRCTSKDF